MSNTTVKSAQAKIDLCWNLLAICAVGMGASLLPDLAFASAAGEPDSNAIEVAFCNVVSLLTSTTGKAIATIAVISVGVGALLGKISWGMALIVAIGVALVFGAATIVDNLGASTATNCSAGYHAITPNAA